MISIIDYGVGNIQAFVNVYKSMGIKVRRARVADDLLGSTRLILPGVGHFDHAMHGFNASGLRPVIEELVMAKEVPILGICVGMQMLATSSEEGALPGLNWVPGHIKSFAHNQLSSNLPMPHMGWNNVYSTPSSYLFSNGFDDTAQFYFLHSYYFDAQDRADVAATTLYGATFDAAVSRGHIHGVQCHPEKSHKWGFQLLKNFAES